MRLTDENPGGFSPVSVDWVAGVSGRLTGGFARPSPVELSLRGGLAAVVTGLQSGSMRPSALRETRVTPNSLILPTGGRQE